MKPIALLAALLLSPLQSAPDRPAYAEGQVWEYRTRPQEPESLLKIQKIEAAPDGSPIYHISITGLKLKAPGGTQALFPHLPVSAETLDRSVTRLSNRTPAFPDAGEGIATWRKDQGGVFTVPVAEILDLVEQAISG